MPLVDKGEVAPVQPAQGTRGLRRPKITPIAEGSG